MYKIFPDFSLTLKICFSLIFFFPERSNPDKKIANNKDLPEWICVWQTNSKDAFILAVLETGVQMR